MCNSIDMFQSVARVQCVGRGLKLAKGAVGDNQDALGPEVREVHSNFTGDTGTVADAGRRHLKGNFVGHLIILPHYAAAAQAS